MADIGSYSSGNVNSGSAKFNNPTSAVSIGSYKSNSTTNTSRSSSSSSSTDISIDFNSFLDDVVINNYDVQEATGVKVVESAEPIAVENNVPWWEKALGWVASAGATVVVAATSVVSGVLDVVEDVGDGVLWAGATVADWFGADTTAVKEFIARDLVSEANEALYEEGGILAGVNNASFMEYDSDAAQAIRSGAKTATEFAAATALTVATGGAAGPVVSMLAVGGVGALDGFGKAAEGTYQTYGTDTTGLQELMIAGSGALNAMSWIANGKLGQGFLNIGKTAKIIGWDKVLQQFGKDVFNKKFWKDAAKKGLLSKSAISNYISSGAMMADDFIPLITGQEEWTPELAVKLCGTYLFNLTVNVVQDGLGDYVTNYSVRTHVIENARQTQLDELNGQVPQFEQNVIDAENHRNVVLNDPDASEADREAAEKALKAAQNSLSDNRDRISELENLDEIAATQYRLLKEKYGSRLALTEAEIKEILVTSKGGRSAAFDYLAQDSALNRHQMQLFSSGNNYEFEYSIVDASGDTVRRTLTIDEGDLTGIKFVNSQNADKGLVGGFVANTDQILDHIADVKSANPNISYEDFCSDLEHFLDAKGFNDGVSVVVFKFDDGDIRIPNGDEYGAWANYWKPGGLTTNGGLEVQTNIDDKGFIDPNSGKYISITMADFFAQLFNN